MFSERNSTVRLCICLVYYRIDSRASVWPEVAEVYMYIRDVVASKNYRKEMKNSKLYLCCTYISLGQIAYIPKIQADLHFD